MMKTRSSSSGSHNDIIIDDAVNLVRNIKMDNRNIYEFAHPGPSRLNYEIRNGYNVYFLVRRTALTPKEQQSEESSAKRQISQCNPTILSGASNS